MIDFLLKFWQPLVVLLIGVLILAFVGYFNWYGDVKVKTVAWIQRKIFRKGFRSEVSADNLFMTITSYALWLGILWLGIAFAYLTYTAN